MSNLRFYSPEKMRVGATVKLSDNAAIHAARVMRLGIGDKLVLFDGSGFDFECVLISVQKSATLAQVLKSHVVNNESPLNIKLLLGISAGDRMDIGIQKAVELGVNQIVPLKTERSVVRLDEDKAKKRVEHWQNVVIAACEQSGRAIIPQVFAPESLSAWLQASLQEASSGGDLMSTQITRVLLSPIGAKKLSEIAKPVGEIQLLIGAEGGLSDKEMALAISQGFQSIVLGPRILRTETAPLAAIATMQTIWGDF
ncbi:MAG: 16S rRNA (uracil(1498)-N(3))-methyltransferase [Methylophilaceae bacterium]